MANLAAQRDRLQQAFAVLFNDLLATWPKEDIVYVAEEVEYNEYGEALEELIAIGIKSGRGFTLDQIRQIEELAAAMNLQDSEWLDQLPKSQSGQPN